MADRISPERRSWLMSRVGAKNTTPEIRVRKVAHSMGLRFRLHRSDLPGKPDLVFPKRRTVVFVHGCFWHRHHGCKKSSTPSTRVDYWLAKFEANQARDVRVIGDLIAQLRQKLSTKRRCEPIDVPFADVKAEAARVAANSNIQRVVPKTWNKHSSNLAGFFDWLIKVGILPDGHPNPLRHGHIPTQKKGRFGRDERDPYSLEEVEAIISTPIWQGRQSGRLRTLPGKIIIRDASYWVPLM